MKIGGLQKTTLIDYPGKPAATIFVSGCNFRCPFCHNPELVLPEEIEKQPEIPLKDIYDFLEERKNFLQGVVICGGEPTIHGDLPDFIKRIKQMDYLVKLDTNGYNPKMLKKLLDDKLLDYVAMDIKAPKERYKELTNVDVDVEKIDESIDILKKENIDFEFRTTVVPGLITKKDIIEIAKWLTKAPKYFLQTFENTTKTIDPAFMEVKMFEPGFLEDLREEIKSYFDSCQIR